MNPAFSVVFLTTASGAGYGMLVWLGVLNAAGALPPAPWFGSASVLLGLALSAAGLLASTLHLGHPERAWRAVSQWRSSWLSREGVMALFTNLPALGFAASWAGTGFGSGLTVALGLVTGLCALLTVICQAMIYASLKPVRQWHSGLVLPAFLLISLFSGGAWLTAMATFWNAGVARSSAAIAVVFAILAVGAKLIYWQRVDAGRPAATIETATGLGGLGPVRMLEAPHTEENFLLREMGYAIARKHAARLRRIALLAGFVIPAVLLLLGIAWTGPVTAALDGLAAVIALPGIYAERWLFFAEATHTVTLYYGRAHTAPGLPPDGRRPRDG